METINIFGKATLDPDTHKFNFYLNSKFALNNESFASITDEEIQYIANEVLSFIIKHLKGWQRQDSK